MMEFKDKVAVITGGAHGIGKTIAAEFEKEGAKVCVIDIAEGSHYVGDISKKEVLESFAAEVIGKYGKVDYLINNAIPMTKGIDECTFEEFQYALNVGVTAPFYLVKLFMPYFNEGASIINISSYRATFYTIIDGQQEIILVDELHNSSSAELLEISLGKKAVNDSEFNKQFKNIDELNGKVFCEMKTTDIEGNENSYTIELELTKITK